MNNGTREVESSRSGDDGSLDFHSQRFCLEFPLTRYRFNVAPKENNIRKFLLREIEIALRLKDGRIRLQDYQDIQKNILWHFLYQKEVIQDIWWYQILYKLNYAIRKLTSYQMDNNYWSYWFVGTLQLELYKFDNLSDTDSIERTVRIGLHISYQMDSKNWTWL